MVHCAGGGTSGRSLGWTPRRGGDWSISTSTAYVRAQARRSSGSGGGEGSFVDISSIARATHRWFGAYGVSSPPRSPDELAADELGRRGWVKLRPGLIRTDSWQPSSCHISGDYADCTTAAAGEVEDIANTRSSCSAMRRLPHRSGHQRRRWKCCAAGPTSAMSSRSSAQRPSGRGALACLVTFRMPPTRPSPR